MKVSKRSLFGKSSVGELEDQAGQDVMRPSPQKNQLFKSYLHITFTIKQNKNKKLPEHCHTAQWNSGS